MDRWSIGHVMRNKFTASFFTYLEELTNVTTATLKHQGNEGGNEQLGSELVASAYSPTARDGQGGSLPPNLFLRGAHH
jgi:hypothetical protein